MTGDTAREADLPRHFNLRVENFEIFGFSDAVGNLFAFDRLSRKGSEVVPDQEALRINQRSDFDAVMLRVAQQVAPGLTGKHRRRNADVTSCAIL